MCRFFLLRRWMPGPGLVPAVLTVLAFVQGLCAQNQPQIPRTEPELIALLKSDASEGDKALACKFLSVYGSSQAVPELAKLLSSDKLGSWSRTALEVIPGAEADEALRKATESLQGRLLVGVINSIGVRRDGKAVEVLAKRLGDADAEVASAAAVSLGKIGSAAAAEPLRKAIASAPVAVRSAVAEGCILCAEQYLAAGNGSEAAKVYDEVRKADVPRQRMLEATRGAILARGKDGIPVLVEQLRSDDKGLFQIGLSTAREFPTREVDQALAAELDRGFPERAALVVVAMADRKETVDVQAVLKAAQKGAAQVRVAAVEALGRIGNAAALPALIDIALETDADLAKAAKESLVALPGDAVNKDIATRLGQAQGKTYPLLLELVGLRRIEATGALLEALKSNDRGVKIAALKSLGSTASEKQLPVLISQVVSSTSADSAEVAQAALKEAAVRMPDREACAAELATALNRAPSGTKKAILEILAAVGGTKALAAVGAAAKGSDPALQDAASGLLGEWMTIDAAPVLLDLAKTSDKFQVRALRGYLRIARQFVMPDEQRLQMATSALDAARRTEERKLVLEVAQRYPTLDMLKLTAKAAQLPDVKDEAKAAATAIGAKLPKNEEVRQLMSKAGAK